MASLNPVFVTAVAGAMLALAPAAGPSERHLSPERRIVTNAGGFGPAALRRFDARMGPADLALAARLDPSRHADLWGRPAAWASLDLNDPPALPKALDAKAAAKVNALMPDLTERTPAPPFVLTGSSAERARAELCLAQAVYYEAALEPLEGQQAVAQTVLNRVRHPFFPKTVCGVVYEGAKALGCQFSFACDGSRDRPPIDPYWARAKAVADAALHGAVDPQVGAATYYHATYVFPVWGPQMVKVGQFGTQVFYRYAGPAGEVTALSGRYAGRELAVSLTGPPAALLKARGGGTPAPPAGVETALASRDPDDGRVHGRLPGEMIYGRRIPTKEEIASINAQVSALIGPQTTTTIEPPAPSN